MKPFLILQLRPEDPGADGEYHAMLAAGGLQERQVKRVRLEQTGIPPLDLADFAGVMVGGGPYNLSDSEDIKPPEQKRFEGQLASMMAEIIAGDIPYLGACYGLSILVKALGGTVSKAKFSEPVGPAYVITTPDAATDPLLHGIPESFRVLLGHKEACQDVPKGAVLLATSEACPVQMVRYGNNVYGTQFHPESDIDTFCERVDIYKNAGYFPPEEAEGLKVRVRLEPVTVPVEILRRFVARYSATPMTA